MCVCALHLCLQQVLVASDPYRYVTKAMCALKMFYVWNFPTLSTQQYCHCTGAQGIFVYLVEGIGFHTHTHTHVHTTVEVTVCF